MAHQLHIQVGKFKFSCAHMTEFPDGTKERLHGHNFALGVQLGLSSLSSGRMVSFAPVKKAMEAFCQSLRETVLIAAQSPHLEIISQSPECEIKLCGKRYVFPAEDVRLLPIENVTCEHLADYAARELLRSLEPTLRAGGACSIDVRIDEAPGQGGSAQLTLG